MDWPLWLRSVLAATRWCVLLLLAFLVLKPFLLRWISEEEKPILAIYQDASDSVPAEEQEAFRGSLEMNESALEEKYDLRILKFGSEADFENAFDSSLALYTDFGALKEDVATRFYNQNVGAILVTTDGIQTKGVSPNYVDDGHTAPYFMLAMGDSSTHPDARIIEVLNNKLVFLNNEFEVKIRVAADQLEGETLNLSLTGNDFEYQKDIEIDQAKSLREISLRIKAEKPGLNAYKVIIEPLPGEENIANNSATFFIDVLDNRTRVQLIAAAPHPDVGAIKRAIEKNEQYEVGVSLASEWSMGKDGYDLAILHGIPMNQNQRSIIEQLQRAKVPIWFVFSSKMDLQELSKSLNGFSIEGKLNRMDQAGPVQSENFNLFNAPRLDEIKRLPPINVPFGEIQLGFPHQTLLKQRVGIVETQRPLWVFYEQDQQKGALLLAEGSWRWRLNNYQLKGNSTWFNEMVGKTVQYLSVRQKRTRLQVTAPERVAERSPVEFKAELYNESFELTNDPEVELSLTDSSGKNFEYLFKPDGNAYRLSIGNLKAGEYQWKALASMNGQLFEERGLLIVNEVKVEQIQKRANHKFLAQWASRENGEMYPLVQSVDVFERLLNLDQAKPIISTEKDWSDLVEWKWLLILLIALLSIEWFLRKYHGAY